MCYHSAMNSKVSTTNYQLKTSLAIQQKKFSFVLGIIVTFSFLFSSYRYLVFPYLSTIAVNKKSNAKVQAVAQKKQVIYTIKEGDDLWKVAESYFGSGYNAYDIAQANKISDPNNLTKGQKIIIPPVTPKTSTVGDISAISTSQVTYKADKYVVQQGDYLWLIALKVYGDGNAAFRIIQANNIPNPEILEPGTVLNIPR